MSQRVEHLSKFFGFKIEGQINGFAFIKEVALQIAFWKTDQVCAFGLRLGREAQQNLCRARYVAVDVWGLAGRDSQFDHFHREDVLSRVRLRSGSGLVVISGDGFFFPNSFSLAD